MRKLTEAAGHKVNIPKSVPLLNTKHKLSEKTNQENDPVYDSTKKNETLRSVVNQGVQTAWMLETIKR